MRELRTSCSRATSRHNPRVLIHTGRYEISSPEGPEELLQHMSMTEDRNSSERCHYPRSHSPHSTWKAINVVVKGLTLEPGSAIYELCDLEQRPHFSQM